MTGAARLITTVRVCPVVLAVTPALGARVVRDARRADDAVTAGGAGAGAAAVTEGGVRSLGTATCGKFTVGSDRTGIETGAAGASASARIVSPIMTVYGTASERVHTTANQNRMRRVPRLFKANVPEVPKPRAPAKAGLSRLCTFKHQALSTQ